MQLGLGRSLFSVTQSWVSLPGASTQFHYGGKASSLMFHSYATPPMLLALSLKTGFVYGAFSVPVCILMWIYLPETKG